ncbi:putative Histidine kinase [Magnetospirillum sp. SS-4]|nr:putative Histidine kinase [Magnetospirillum sp. SS-4]
MVVWLVAAAIAITWGATGLWLWSDHDATLNAGKDSLWRRSVVTAEQTERLFSVVDMTFAGIAGFLAANSEADPLADSTVDRLVTECVKLLDSTLNIRMIDSAGIMYMLPESDGKAAAVVADRDYFRDAQAGRMIVSQPVFSRITGEWVIPASRRLDRPAGRIVIVHAAIHTSRLDRLYEAIRTGPDSSVALYRNDGTLLARSPAGDGLIGRKFSNLVFQRLGITNSPRDVDIVEKSPIDGRARLVVARPIKHYDLTLVLTSPVDEVLAPWHQRLTLAGLGAVAVSLMILGGGAMLWNLLGRLEAVAQTKESRIRELSDFNTSVVAHSPLAIALYGEDGRCVLANQATADLTGGTVGQLLTQNFRDLASWRSSGMLDVARDVLARGGHRRLATRMLTTFGRRLDIEADFVAISVDGRPHLLLVTHDVTHRVATEREARLARDEAERANKAKSAFLANFSHELRTPLNAVLGFSDALLSGAFGETYPPRCVEYLRHINESGQHLLALINDILDISIIEAGRMELHPADMDAGRLCDEALGMVRPGADIKGVVLTFEEPVPPMVLHVDGRRMRQVLVNLLANAVKFTPAGGSVSLRAARNGDGGMDIAVADTGIGMDEAGIAKALTPFGQLGDPFTRRRQDGVGLGLPLSRQLVELHGGSLLIDSVPGQGTTITVRLPTAMVA